MNLGKNTYIQNIADIVLTKYSVLPGGILLPSPKGIETPSSSTRVSGKRLPLGDRIARVDIRVSLKLSNVEKVESCPPPRGLRLFCMRVWMAWNTRSMGTDTHFPAKANCARAGFLTACKGIHCFPNCRPHFLTQPGEVDRFYHTQ